MFRKTLYVLTGILPEGGKFKGFLKCNALFEIMRPGVHEGMRGLQGCAGAQ